MNIRRVLVFVSVNLILVKFACGQEHKWAQLVTYDLSQHERSMASIRQGVTLERKLPLSANQLIISWNARRPRAGYFSLYLRVRESYGRSWSRWYKMADWGAHVQRTYPQLSKHMPSFAHVRFQMPRGRFTDLCEVKVIAHGGADLAELYRIAILAADYSHFVSQLRACRSFSFPSMHITGVPAYSQMQLNHRHRERICSPTSLSMLISYLMGHREDPLACADAVYDYGLHGYGSWTFNVAHAFDRCGGAYYFCVTRLESFADLYEYLTQGIPVVVSVRGRLATMPPGHAYAEGHLLLVVGWDNQHKRVQCHDPAFASDGLVAHDYSVCEFVAAWERSYRLAYVTQKRVEVPVNS